MTNGTELAMTSPTNEFECANFRLTDEILSSAKIAAYMYNQVLKKPDGEEKPYNPKSFPEKAVDIMIPFGKDNVIEIFLLTEEKAWDSKFRYEGRICRLGPDQMQDFFMSEFYGRMITSLSKKWPLSDKTFGELFDAVTHKRMYIGGTYGLDETEAVDEANMPNKRVALANKDVTGDGKRDYTSTGRKIESFSDMGVKGGSGKYYCWPNPKFEWKWSQWKDWEKIKPLCKMEFVHNGRHYGISLGLFDENFDNRGFRGFDADWDPPLSWLTPGECDQVMQLSVVRRFIRQCVKRIKKYLDMTPSEIYDKMTNKDKITPKEIEKTQRVIKHVMDTALKHEQADTYQFD